MHPARDFARVDSFPGTVLGQDPRLSEINFACDAFHERFGTGDDGSDLERPLQKSLEKQNAHEGANSQLPLSPCPVRMSLAGRRKIGSSITPTEKQRFFLPDLTSAEEIIDIPAGIQDVSASGEKAC